MDKFCKLSTFLKLLKVVQKISTSSLAESINADNYLQFHWIQKFYKSFLHGRLFRRRSIDLKWQGKKEKTKKRKTRQKLWGKKWKSYQRFEKIASTYWKLVRITIGWPKKLGTDSSISECVLIKFNVKSGRVLESLTHWPGRGSGTLALCTGNQLELIALCSLKLPSNVSEISWSENAQTAEPLILFTGVVNVPYISWADTFPYCPDIRSVVDSKNLIQQKKQYIVEHKHHCWW